jgi:hypothetical protein
VTRTGWLQAGAIASAIAEVLEAHLIEHRDHERLAGELLDLRGQGGDLLLKADDPLVGPGHSDPPGVWS